MRYLRVREELTREAHVTVPQNFLAELPLTEPDQDPKAAGTLIGARLRGRADGRAGDAAARP